MNIWVIIPFYQNKKGLIQKAVASIFKQDTENVVRVVVVDDESPIDARTDLGASVAQFGDRLIILKQANAGPGCARNRGLEAIAGDAAAVAFLDSDDVWEPGHLTRVRNAIAAGADFFFSDYRRGDSQTRFAQIGFNYRESSLIDRESEIYLFTGDFFDLLLRGAPVGTSTVAFNYRAMPEIRFDPHLRAGEDILFWMNVSRRAKKVMFSTKLGAHYGVGVNIYEGAEWGTVAGMQRVFHSARFHTLVEETFRLTVEQRKWNRFFLRSLDAEFIQSALVAALKRGSGWSGIIREYINLRPCVLARLPAVGMELIRGKLQR